jgi:hypothetical protein
MLDVGDRPMTWLANRGADVGLISQDSADRLQQKVDERRKQFETDYGDSTTASVGRTLGQTAATVPLTMGAGSALGAGARAAANLAPRTLPAVNAALEFASGAGGGSAPPS